MIINISRQMNTRISILLFALAISFSSMAQFGLKGVGVGINGHATGNMNHEGIAGLFTESVFQSAELGKRIFMSRTNTSYTFTFQGANADFFALDLSVLQGADNMYNSDYRWRNNGDSSFSSSIDLDISSATLGMRVMAKFRTDPSKRFHYNFGLGAESIFAYGVSSSGRGYLDISHWPSGYFYSESEEIATNIIKNYQSHQIIQQVGGAFRLAEDDQHYPLDRTYIELNFNIFSNFALINNKWSSFRSYGGALRLIYEIR